MNSKLLNETLSEVIQKHNEEENKKLYQFEKNKLYAYLEDLKDSLKKHNAYIAGGTITSLFTGAEINDLDIYFRNEKDAIGFLEDHWQDGKTYVTCLTNKAVLLVNGESPDFKNLQLIHFKYFEKPEDIFNTFDFTVCMGAFDFVTEQFTMHPQFIKHNSQRILKFNPETAFPIVSLLRVHKYNNKKYSISKPEFIRIVLKCMTLQIDTIEKLKEHLGGMYGINYDKIINLDEGEEFSLDLFIAKIADIALSEDYFKKPAEIKFDDLDEIIDTIKKSPVNIIELQDKVYRVSQNDELKELKTKPMNSISIDPNKFFYEKRYYKWVKKINDGDFRSHYDANFKYKDGLESVANGTKLWLLEKSNIESGTYNHQGVVIEVSIKPEHFIGYSGNDVYTKACTVIREVPKSEWEKWVNETVEDSLGDNDPF